LLKTHKDSEGNDVSDAEKVSYEWSHVVFFPNLLLHDIYNDINGIAFKDI